MFCVTQAALNRKQVKKQIIAVAFLVCFIVVFLTSEAFILTHARHNHDHNGLRSACSTCIQLENAENILKQLGAAVTGTFFIFTEVFTASAIIRIIYSNTAILTPVTLKIRMNN